MVGEEAVRPAAAVVTGETVEEGLEFADRRAGRV